MRHAADTDEADLDDTHPGGEKGQDSCVRKRSPDLDREESSEHDDGGPKQVAVEPQRVQHISERVCTEHKRGRPEQLVRRIIQEHRLRQPCRTRRLPARYGLRQQRACCWPKHNQSSRHGHRPDRGQCFGPDSHLHQYRNLRCRIPIHK